MIPRPVLPAAQLRPASQLIPQLLVLLLLLLGITAHAATLQVPSSSYPTIQSAINAASTGDTILVAPGTYFENLSINSAEITLRSTAGPASTILNGSTLGPTLLITNTKSLHTTIDGFTITGGGSTSNPAYGATSGLALANAGATIANNIFTGSSSSTIEIGLHNASATILSNHFDTAPPTPQQHGAKGIVIDGPTPLLDASSKPVPVIITANIITGDATGQSGDAIQGISDQLLIIDNNTITGNANGINLTNDLTTSTGTTLIQQNIIANNAYSALVINRVSAPPYTDPAAVFVLSNTIVNNATTITSPTLTSSIALSQTYSQIAFINNIITQATVAPLIACSPATTPPISTTPTIFDHNDLFSSTGSPIAAAPCTSPVGSFGNLSVDPQFVDPTHGDYHLRSLSLAIDAGNNSAPSPAINGDFSSTPRLQDATGSHYPIIDLGVYEAPGLQDAQPTTLTLTPNAYTLVVGSTVTITATATSAAGIPTGSVTFFEDNQPIQPTSTVLLGANGVTPVSIPSLTLGVHSFTVTYPGQGSFTPAVSVPFYILVAPAPVTTTITTLTAIPTTISGFQNTTLTAAVTNNASPVTAGTVTFTANGTLLGSAPLSTAGTATLNVNTLAPGTYNLVATFTATATLNASTSNTVVETVLPTPTAITLVANPNTAPQGEPVTITAVVSASGLAIPNGQISFLDGANLLQLATLDATGTATFSTSTLAIGTHTLSAVYSAEPSFGPSRSNNATVVITPQNFTLTTTPPTITLQTQHHTSLQINLTGLGGFTDTVNLSCKNPPPHVTCTFPANNPALSNTTTSANVTLNLDTSAVLGYAANHPEPRPNTRPNLRTLTTIAFALLLPITLATRRRLPIRLLLVLLATSTTILALSGCSGLLPASTPPGTYTLTIYAHGNATNINHPTNLTLIVTP